MIFNGLFCETILFTYHFSTKRSNLSVKTFELICGNLFINHEKVDIHIYSDWKICNVHFLPKRSKSWYKGHSFDRGHIVLSSIARILVSKRIVCFFITFEIVYLFYNKIYRITFKNKVVLFLYLHYHIMTAQDVLNQEENQTAGTACWTACGASEGAKTEEPTPVACGASEWNPKEEPTPAACGTACWAWE